MQIIVSALCLSAMIGFAGAATVAAPAPQPEQMSNDRCAVEAMQRYEEALAVQRSLVSNGISLPSGSGAALLALRKAASEPRCAVTAESSTAV